MIAGVLIAFAVAVSSSEATAAASAPYSLPWQLRGAGPANIVRADAVLAFHNAGFTEASMLFASYRVSPTLAPFVRLGYVAQALTGQPTAHAIVNPALGATYGIAVPRDFRLSLFFGFTLPIGMGGGNVAPSALAVPLAGLLARSAMDNAMFAVNDFTIFPGIDLAWVAHGFTVQIETTLLMLTRVRGERTQADEMKANLTAGLHVGYFLSSWWSVGAELRHQRWLTTPAAVVTNPSARDNTTFAVGTRFHVPVAGVVLRPGVAYTRGLDAPMTTANYNIVLFDLPVFY